MKRLNILCENTKIVEARAKTKEIMNADVLTTPLSKSGKAPVTHWFCSLNVNEEGYQKIMGIQEHSIIEEGVPSQFLEKYNLKKIKSFGSGL